MQQKTQRLTRKEKRILRQTGKYEEPKLNFHLKNESISILKTELTNADFDSRRDAKLRIYKYVIINRESPLSIEKDRAWQLKIKLDELHERLCLFFLLQKLLFFFQLSFQLLVQSLPELIYHLIVFANLQNECHRIQLCILILAFKSIVMLWEFYSLIKILLLFEFSFQVFVFLKLELQNLCKQLKGCH